MPLRLKRTPRTICGVVLKPHAFRANQFVGFEQWPEIAFGSPWSVVDGRHHLAVEEDLDMINPGVHSEFDGLDTGDQPQE
jgi:hypothetical protein